MKCAREDCAVEFETRHAKKKFCSRKCCVIVTQRKQIEFRTNPFRGLDGCDFEPTIESSWFESEAERKARLQRKQLNER